MRALLAVVSVLLTACQITTAAVGPSEPAPGARASITLEQMQVAGGNPWLSVLTFDSATLSYESRTCNTAFDIARCPNLVSTSGRSIPGPLTEVFQRVNSSEGRSVRATYTFDGDVRPPDMAQVSVTVVSNGRRWRVQWDPRARHPSILGQIACRLEQARGALILCAQE